MLKVVVVDIKFNIDTYENIEHVNDTSEGKLVLLRKDKTVAVYNKDCWVSWRDI